MAKRGLGKLKNEIEKIREEMIRSGMEKGFNHAETIELSQKLDKLIYQSMSGGKK